MTCAAITDQAREPLCRVTQRSHLWSLNSALELCELVLLISIFFFTALSKSNLVCIFSCWCSDRSSCGLLFPMTQPKIPGKCPRRFSANSITNCELVHCFARLFCALCASPLCLQFLTINDSRRVSGRWLQSEWERERRGIWTVIGTIVDEPMVLPWYIDVSCQSGELIKYWVTIRGGSLCDRCCVERSMNCDRWGELVSYVTENGHFFVACFGDLLNRKESPGMPKTSKIIVKIIPRLVKTQRSSCTCFSLSVSLFFCSPIFHLFLCQSVCSSVVPSVLLFSCLPSVPLSVRLFLCRSVCSSGLPICSSISPSVSLSSSLSRLPHSLKITFPAWKFLPSQTH
jgi:hypothetical protein